MFCQSDSIVRLQRHLEDLEEKLMKGEAERKVLEAKFLYLTETYKYEEVQRANRLNNKYLELLDSYKERSKRNYEIMKSLQRVESGASVVFAKTERLKMLRSHYDAILPTSLWRETAGIQRQGVSSRVAKAKPLSPPPLLQNGGSLATLQCVPNQVEGHLRLLRLNNKVLATLGVAGERMMRELDLIERSTAQPQPESNTSCYLSLHDLPNCLFAHQEQATSKSDHFPCSSEKKSEDWLSINYKRHCECMKNAKYSGRNSIFIRNPTKVAPAADIFVSNSPDQLKTIRSFRSRGENEKQWKDNIEIECLTADANYNDDDLNLSDDEVLDVAHLDPHDTKYLHNYTQPSFGITFEKQRVSDISRVSRPTLTSRPPNTEKVAVAHKKSVAELKALLYFSEEGKKENNADIDKSVAEPELNIAEGDEDVPDDFTEQNYVDPHRDSRLQRDVSRNVILEEDEEDVEDKIIGPGIRQYEVGPNNNLRKENMISHNLTTSLQPENLVSNQTGYNPQILSNQGHLKALGSRKEDGKKSGNSNSSKCDVSGYVSQQQKDKNFQIINTTMNGKSVDQRTNVHDKEMIKTLTGFNYEHVPLFGEEHQHSNRHIAQDRKKEETVMDENYLQNQPSSDKKLNGQTYNENASRMHPQTEMRIQHGSQWHHELATNLPQPKSPSQVLKKKDETELEQQLEILSRSSQSKLNRQHADSSDDCKPTELQYSISTPNKKEYQFSQPEIFNNSYKVHNRRKLSQGNNLKQQQQQCQSGSGYETKPQHYESESGYETREPQQYESEIGYETGEPQDYEPDSGYETREPQQYQPENGYETGEPQQYGSESGYETREPQQYQPENGYETREPQQYESEIGYETGEPQDYEPDSGYETREPQQYQPENGYETGEPQQYGSESGYETREPQQYQPENGYETREPQQYQPENGYETGEPQDYEPESGYEAREPQQYESEIGYETGEPQDYEPESGYEIREPQQYEPEIGYETKEPQHYEPESGYEAREPQQYESEIGYETGEPQQYGSESGCEIREPQHYEPESGFETREPQQYESEICYERGESQQYESESGYFDKEPTGNQLENHYDSGEHQKYEPTKGCDANHPEQYEAVSKYHQPNNYEHELEKPNEYAMESVNKELGLSFHENDEESHLESVEHQIARPSVLHQLIDSEPESYLVEPAETAYDDSDFDFSIGKQ